jgi:UDP-glucose 4-epimerase
MTYLKRCVTVLGAGFIGMNFIRYAQQNGYALSVLDHKPVPADIAGQVNWFQGDLACEADMARALTGADTVFHFISSTVPGDQVDMALELQHNVFQILQLLNLCVDKKVRRIVFISSASVYGIQERLPIPETAPTDPISSHGIHKLTIEKYLQLYRHQYGLDCKIVRLSNPYGPGQSITGRQGFIAISIGHIITGDSILIRGDGTVIRDFIYIDDVSEALNRICATDSDEFLFNIGSGSGYSLNEVIAEISELTGQQIPVIYTKSRFADIPESVLDTSRSRMVLGFEPNLSLRAGLARTLIFNGVACAKA